ncbi:MAG: hypothetical protein N6V49_03020, partial [Serratia symbiotica]|nr:hypothetical protein [Serratia symbiotica]
CSIFQFYLRLATAVENKMGPSNSASRGKAKKFFFIVIQIMVFPHPHAFAYKIRRAGKLCFLRF